MLDQKVAAKSGAVVHLISAQILHLLSQLRSLYQTIIRLASLSRIIIV